MGTLTPAKLCSAPKNFLCGGPVSALGISLVSIDFRLDAPNLSWYPPNNSFPSRHHKQHIHVFGSKPCNSIYKILGHSTYCQLILNWIHQTYHLPSLKTPRALNNGSRKLLVTRASVAVAPETQTKVSLIRIGTRGRDKITASHSDIAEEGAIQIVVIKTTGDKILSQPLADIGGKGLFTKELFTRSDDIPLQPSARGRELPAGSIVGNASFRRKSQILDRFPSRVLETSRKGGYALEDMILMGKDAGQELLSRAGPGFFNS